MLAADGYLIGTKVADWFIGVGTRLTASKWQQLSTINAGSASIPPVSGAFWGMPILPAILVDLSPFRLTAAAFPRQVG
jgi:hypothetical protein